MTDRCALFGNPARHSRLTTCGYPDLGDEAFDLVVNATSASMRGELPPVTRAAFAPGCVAYDLAKTVGSAATPRGRGYRLRGAGRRHRSAVLMQARDRWIMQGEFKHGLQAQFHNTTEEDS